MAHNIYWKSTGQVNEDAVKHLVMAALRQHFKPELLNRLDDIIMFHSLTNDQYYEIAEKYIAIATKTCCAARN